MSCPPLDVQDFLPPACQLWSWSLSVSPKEKAQW
jgi:hypothetical protein